MKTGKKVSITILSVLILALCAVGIIRSTTFPLDPATLPDHICDFYNIGRPQPLSPRLSTSATAAGASMTALCAVGRKPTTSLAAAM